MQVRRRRPPKRSKQQCMSAAVTARIQGYLRAMAGSVLSNFDQKLPVPTVWLKLRQVFDYRLMPLGDGEGEHERLLTWSDGALAWLVEQKFPHLDVQEVQAGAMRVQHYVKQKCEVEGMFHVRVPVLDESGDPVMEPQPEGASGPAKKVPVTASRIGVAGEGSVLQQLFTKRGTIGAGIRGYLEIADYMIAYKFNQSDTERAGRNMTLTKTPNRHSLTDENFSMLVWLSFNAPLIHQVDFRKFVQRWELEKHELALFKEFGDSKIIDRLAAMQRNSPLT